MKQGTLLATPRDDCVSPLGLTIIYRKIGVKSFGLQYPAIRRLQGLKDKQQEVGSLPSGKYARTLRLNQPTIPITKTQCPDTAVYVGRQGQPSTLDLLLRGSQGGHFGCDNAR